LSYNTLDLSAIPATEDFGSINPRDIRPAAVTALAKEFMNDTFTPFLPHCTFPVLLNPDELHESCVSTNAVFDGSAPRLVLAKKIKSLVFCGGRHRVAAVKQARKDLQSRIDKCLRFLQPFKVTNPAEGEDVYDLKDDAQAKEMYWTLQAARQRIDVLNIWGCIVYHRGTCVSPRSVHSHLC
jgi:hypothetical protein